LFPTIHAWIFDLDDTLVSSGPVWVRAERELYAELGGTYDEAYAATYRGLNAEGVAAAIIERLGLDRGRVGDSAAFLRSRLIDLAASESRALKGATELLRRVARYRSVAIASGSPAAAIERVIRRFGWDDAVRLWVSSEAVPAGKPAPDVFLETARCLGETPDRCLVVEDSVPGVKAAAAAGMRCIAVPSTDASSGDYSGAERCFGSLVEIDPERVEAYGIDG
jgi:HAD superfamily hydrolase (TIGR01509 family)